MQVVSDGGNEARSTAVLLIEDDADVRRFVHERLSAQGFTVSEAPSGERGLEVFETQRFDVVLLDVHLPGIDGFAVLRSIRRTSQVPVLLLTAASDEADRVLGLEIGADDYIIKPFLPRELVARIRAVLRRARPVENVAVMTFGSLVIDPHAREVLLDGQLVKLTGREFDLLGFMAASPRRAYTREQLLQQVWNSEASWQNVATVTEHIHRLRRRIEADPATPRFLVTVRGAGYRFDP
jgi:two-component system phosphate regulon response regulator PhoB